MEESLDKIMNQEMEDLQLIILTVENPTIQTRATNQEGENFVTPNVTGLYQGMEKGTMPQLSNMNQPRACVFTQEQYSQILQMVNKSSAFSESANALGSDDISGSLKWECEGDW
ncbi:uncharacterized protein LOC132037702 isoform X2 [Lycium ferocissimum]|uniref:uncharacterized protein LOC132037702 isoform X2 n=1 Tax=Lycium ferocissimum TaxID=112874 RepID=UPI0028169D27|nr:uncharacterized protein LOC132037702 isoform X2 [Lycium ferocissimum]